MCYEDPGRHTKECDRRAGVGSGPAASSSMAPQKETAAADVGGKSAEHKEAGAQSLTPSDQEERVDAGSENKTT